MSEGVVYTAGVFDLFHVGHLRILQRSRALGAELIVGVISDVGTEAYKGRRPVFCEKDRMEIVRSLCCVDHVFLQPTTDPSPLVEKFRPNIFTHGNDWERLLEGHETLERLGIDFVLLPYTEGISTTAVRGICGG